MAITATGTNRGPTRRHLHTGVVGLLAATVLTGCLHSERVSTTIDGGLANGASRVSSISTDGRYVAFGSDATNLYPDDTNGYQDLFIRDNVTGDVELAAIRADGQPATQRGSAGKISDDGRYVTYTTSEQATPDDTDNFGDTFVHDRVAGTTVLASRPPEGIADDRGWGGVPSANGRFVVFNGLVAAWVYDVAASTTQMVTTGSAYPAVVSDDGNIVALVSYARLTAEDTTNNTFDVYVYNLAAGTIDMLNQTMFAGGYLRHGSLMYNIDITPDGRYVAYSAQIYNDPGFPDAYVYDRVTDTADKLPEPPKPANHWVGHELAPTISDDGRYVAYTQSLWSELADAPGRVVTYDRQAKSMTVIEDLPTWKATGPTLISGDGRYVTFGAATVEDPGDTNGVEDVLIRFAHQPQVTTADPAELGPGTHEIVVDAAETYGQPAVVVTGEGVTVDSVAVEGTQLRLEVTVAATAAPGPRGLLVTNDGSWPGRLIIGGTGLCNGCIVLDT